MLFSGSLEPLFSFLVESIDTLALLPCNINHLHGWSTIIAPSAVNYLIWPPPPPSLIRCRQHIDRRQRRRKPPPTILHQNQQLNNQSDNAQSLKDGGVRLQEVPMEMTCHPLHNGSASSGFVDEMENDMLKYGRTSFNGGKHVTTL